MSMSEMQWYKSWPCEEKGTLAGLACDRTLVPVFSGSGPACSMDRFEREPNDVYESNAMIQVGLQPQAQPRRKAGINTGLDIAATLLLYLHTFTE